MKNPYEGLVKTLATDKGYRGMTPNTAQKRDEAPHHSLPKAFQADASNRDQGE